MVDKNKVPPEAYALLQRHLGDDIDKYEFPPPVFELMSGEVIELNVDEPSLVCRFPIEASYLNPYGSMQGGMIAAIIDNTIGPLSMLVAKPNFTRHMELKYGKAVTPDLDFAYVSARFIEQKKRLLYFEAEVQDREGNKLVSARATHWVIA